LLRVDETMAMLGVSKGMLKILRDQYGLTPVYVGHAVRYKLSDVEQYIADLKAEPPRREIAEAAA
jgi:hypothetical protein